MSIHSKIRSMRMIKGYSQEYMANKLNISQNAFSRLELGHAALTIDRLHQIASIFEIKIEELLTDSERSVATQNQMPNSDLIKMILDEKDKQINHLSGEIKFLREQLNTSRR